MVFIVQIKLKIWHKLALAIITIMLIVLVISMLLTQNSFKVGFLHYLNSLENKRINVLERQLVKDYQANGDWDFLPRRRGWGKYVNDALRPPNDREHNRGEKKGREGRHRHRYEHQAPPPSFEFEDQQRRPPPPPRRQPPKHPLHNLASKDETEFTGKHKGEERHLSLYSTQHVLISGIPKDENDASITKRPIRFKQQIIAYLYIIPFKKLTTQLDQDFVKQQSRSFIEISLIAFIISLIGSWLLAFYFRKRIAPLNQIAHQLTSGNYQYRASIKQDDELGKLALDLNELGKTLEHNQSSRQQWIADISHELRTPLSILRGELEALEDGIRPLNKPAIQSLVVEIKRLGKLVEDLYQLSLSDLGALHYVKESIDLHHLLQDVVAFFNHRFSENNISASIQYDGTNTHIFGDEKRLFQLFSNLFENTVRYTNAGGLIQIQCYAHNNKVIVKIEDSKPAVSDQQLTRLFDRLYRVEASRNRASGGAGLGLSIVKAIADAHNANIITSHSSLGGLAVALELEQYEP